MREIKFDYVFKNNSSGAIKRKIRTLSDVEKGTVGIAGHTVIARRQCTDLKDKNSVEICEGDIVVYDDLFGICYEVRFSCGVVHLDGLCGQLEVSDPLYGVHEECEVIGNIYENQELLKSDQ